MGGVGNENSPERENTGYLGYSEHVLGKAVHRKMQMPSSGGLAASRGDVDRVAPKVATSLNIAATVPTYHRTYLPTYLPPYTVPTHLPTTRLTYPIPGSLSLLSLLLFHRQSESGRSFK